MDNRCIVEKLSLPPLDSLGLPEKFERYRREQEEVLEKALNYERLLAEAPPGVGKTIIAAALQKILGVPTTYITPDKSLQYQICKEIPEARMVMGRSNYQCLAIPEMTAEVCFHSKEEPCALRNNCPYVVARAAAESSALAVLNSSYYLYASNYADKFRRPLLIVDEVDMFEQAILGFVKIDLTSADRRRLERSGLGFGGGVAKDWVDWSKKSFPEVSSLSRHAPVEEREHWKRLSSKMQFMLDHVDDGWFTEEEEGGKVSFRPLQIKSYAGSLVWSNHSRVLGMSGTIIDSQVVAEGLGLPGIAFVSTPCPFPVENRPIYWAPVEELNNSNLRASVPMMSLLLSRILDAYSASKVLIHTQSYYLAKWLDEALEDERIMMNENSKDRQDVLEAFLASSGPFVLLSPSFSRGLDLKEDVYNCVVVAKAPYPNMGSQAVSLRMKLSDGQRWYNREATAALVQMCCRAVRTKEKKCDIWIIDGNCLRLLKMSPKWIQDAVQEPEQ